MGSLAFAGGVALLELLGLELADRAAMKRDLEIAREIQSWPMLAAPPQIPGVDIAFAARPANTVAGDYYDAFFRPAAPGNAARLLLVADVAGKSIPAALLTATPQASLRTLAALPGSLPDLVERLNETLKQLMSSVEAFVGLTRLHDDITCLLLRTFNPQ